MLPLRVAIAANKLVLHCNACGMAETKIETGNCEMLRGSETENGLNIACMTAENVLEVRVNIDNLLLWCKHLGRQWSYRTGTEIKLRD